MRSLPADGDPCLDVLFEDVSWIEMPTTFDSLAIMVSLRLDTNEGNTPVNGFGPPGAGTTYA